MKFSEKRKLQKHQKFHQLVINGLLKKETITVKPNIKGWPNFNVEDLEYVQKELEKIDACMIGYVMEHPDTNAKTIAWVVFGYYPKPTWHAHCIMVKEYLDFAEALKLEQGDSLSPDLKNVEHTLLEHAEEVRKSLQKLSGVELPAFSYHKLKNIALN